MTVRQRDLCSPTDLLRGGSLAAITKAAQFGPDDRTGAQPHGFRYGAGNGGWFQLILLANERALFLGVDRDSSRTVGSVDLRQELPGWVAPFTPPDEGGGPAHWWGFVLWWENGAWWSVDHAVPDGADKGDLFPVHGESEWVPYVADAVEDSAYEYLGDDDPREEATVSLDAVRRVVQAGPDLDEATLLEALVFEEMDLAAGVAAARTFGSVRPLAPGVTELGYRIGPEPRR